ncbi:Scaffold-type E3 ligase [Komagataella phaffii CBS 7435]|uniref:Defective in cullin neddylation protein n=2 Tax=Komagataella phaffii TaxID=460519 RepID=C4R168_KOMPG|nr:Putative Nedd8 ligase [Komagataella phaffii GS115]AOA62610.1 GQ67_00663T0 [Komagataella phaffii]CAH2448231.1 Scaffold-type E3 ligase [Komagataella phaffii CBS 7435]AOA67131.1 GQ68_00725T0 [Komagataella phaffii GS115]CAY69242.1 Putative Nedd8 ligase [Komagataella phaffii GS115]CCA38366.1 Scaffold-type E3 ligase [Komagataella phaffii CBS 7435]
MAPRSVQKLVESFKEVTDLRDSEATAWLTKYKWNLEDAVEAYLTQTSMNSQGQNFLTQEQKGSLISLFNKYKQDGEDYIGIDGTIQYIEDLEFEVEDPVVLALAEFLESTQMGVFERAKFVNNWEKAGISSIHEMRQKVLEFQRSLENDEQFLKKVYDFTFKFLLDNNQRTLLKDTAVEYWKLLLSHYFGEEKMSQWCQFINDEWQFAITKDQWQMLFLFMSEWNQKDNFIESYDENAAWPSMMDTFVEYLRAKTSS